MKKIKTLLTLAVVTTLITTVGYLSFSKKTQLESSKASFLTTNPWKENVEIKKQYVAQIRSIQHIELRSFEKGYLQNIYVDEGQLVKKDQNMFQIMPLLMRSEFDYAKAEYEVARIEYVNTLSLQQKNVVSANELALSNARLDKAKAKMNLRDAHLKMTMIKAPFDGVMDRFNVRLGSLVKEGQLLTTLSDNSKMWVYFNVSEADYLDYKLKKTTDTLIPATLMLANGDVFKHEGVVDTIEADFNNETGNIAFRATFINPEGLLRQGETGNILIATTLNDAIVIPQKATFEILDKRYVYIVDAENKIEQRQIEVKNEIPHLFVIQSGLKDGDIILLEGLGKVHDGQKINTTYQKPAEVMQGLKLSTK